MLAGEAKVRLRLATDGLKGELNKAKGLFGSFSSGIKNTFSAVGGWMKNIIASPLTALAGVFGIIRILQRLFRYLKLAWDEIFKGQSEEKQKRLMGLISGIADKFRGFIHDIGKAGLFDSILNAVQTIYDLVQKWSAEGKLKVWAESIGAALSKAVNFVTDMVRLIGEGNFDAIGAKIGTALGKGLEILLKNDGLISKLTDFGMRLGIALIKAFWAGIKSFVVNPKDFDRDKNPLLWLLFSGGGGEILGGVNSDFLTSSLNPGNMRSK